AHAGRQGVIILHEAPFETQFAGPGIAPSLGEEATGIAEAARLHQFHVRDRGLHNGHGLTYSYGERTRRPNTSATARFRTSPVRAESSRASPPSTSQKPPAAGVARATGGMAMA